MNAKGLTSKFGSGLFAAVVLGMLAALPAQAGSGLTKVTHAATPYRGGYQSVPSTVTEARTTVSQVKTTAGEVQIAVMANAPFQPGARRSVFIHR